MLLQATRRLVGGKGMKVCDCVQGLQIKRKRVNVWDRHPLEVGDSVQIYGAPLYPP